MVAEMISTAIDLSDDRISVLKAICCEVDMELSSSGCLGGSIDGCFTGV
ncbi:unnamed protein product [Brassica napus]|uniref:(rape) hypothetical protein n=1 Tax=Brassica napus TaxID=3708 RepID=A0A816PJX3_BRANA|nr:unnamed protein product [Brassica napus]